MMELRRISRNGHSLQIMLPRPFLAALKLTARSVVCLELIDDTIVISRAVSEREFTRVGPTGKRGAHAT